MVIVPAPDLASALAELARQKNVTPESLALAALRERFLAGPPVPQDEWERRLLSAASDCGVSLSNEALSSEGLYE
jgi:hypothetical protein